ncbi:phosphate transport system permease protein [Ardenticatena maritima]|uniref:Phosphate transport system permease protein PstA n=1 Tax=Ardenticatena maritima TaxID=872965 RepID=A0A0M8K927_9CHLR|nr:phosphate ABC transporter permease PstA [Ardenticatena maritima]KPL87873.1 phosphate ABC transporter permease [Ardenticatena maritima]GAP64303.1 phosphate transport system permease protein [Ardenticatena maritima]
MTLHDIEFEAQLARRRLKGRIFEIVALLAITIALTALALLFWDVLRDGLGRLNWQFLTSYPSRRAARAGFLPAIVGSVYMVGLMVLFAFPIGVGAAVYLEEYAPKNWLTDLIQINIANLAGVPSIIYGLLGLEFFARVLGAWTGGRSLLTGALTMALLVMPIVIISAREAIRAVPNSVRLAAIGLGATRWQVVRDHVLPYAMPGILTGTILAISRAIGETAPLITIGALTYVAFLPDSLHSQFTVMPIQIFNWISRPQADFHANAAAGIIVLLTILLSMNALAVFLRYRFEQRLKG